MERSQLKKITILSFFVSFIIISSSIQVSGIYTNNRIEGRINKTGNQGKILILVMEDIFSDLKKELLTFINDIESDGYLVELYHKEVIDWRTPQKVRKFIKSHITDLIGCILVGHIPMPQYKIKGYMNEYEIFPCDYYYMDLDGSWEFQSDNYYNGFYYSIFKNHTAGNGDVEPEIWVGRITPDLWLGDEVELLKDYFDRNHKYRTRENPRSSRALLYIDDPWTQYADEYKNYMKKVYPSSSITVVTDEEKTRKKDFMKKVKSGNFEWVELHAHSNYLYHKFIHNDGRSWDSLTIYDLKENFTDVIFYVLYSCEALHYHFRNLGSTYLFGQTSGLVVIGSSKIGGINDKGKHLYTNVGNGLNIGESFKIWFTERGIKFPSYCMGMMTFGDPTLKPLKDTNPPDVDITLPDIGTIYLAGREIMKFTPSNNFDSIVIKPMDIQIKAIDEQSGIKQVNVLLDEVSFSAQELSDNIWSYPIINNNYYTPEIHSYKPEAKDKVGNIGLGKERKICSIMANSPPFLYQQIIGPTIGKTGEKLTYSVKLIELEGEEIYYRFNWGDGTESDWLGPIKTNVVPNDPDSSLDAYLITIEEKHEFKNSGNYTITVEVKDSNDNNGLYSLSLNVGISKKSRNLDRIFDFKTILSSLFERFRLFFNKF